MPAKIIQFETEFGPVKVLTQSKSGVTPMSGGNDNENGGKFSSALNSLKGVAHTVWDKISTLPNKPDEVEVKLGLTLSGETGKIWEFIIAKAESEATIEVTLKWSNNNKSST
jgi:hypothetical protein